MAAAISTPVDAVTTGPTTEARYDRQAVHDFLRSHGVFRSSTSDTHPDSEWAREPFDSTPTREQEWRDLLDLELGLTTPAGSSELSSVLGEESASDDGQGEAQVLGGVATLGADFFGERKAVACWNPHMEQHVRRETTVARRQQPTS